MGIRKKNNVFFSFSVNFAQREKYKLLLLCFSSRRCEHEKENTFIMSGLAHIIPGPEHQSGQLMLKPPTE